MFFFINVYRTVAFRSTGDDGAVATAPRVRNIKACPSRLLLRIGTYNYYYYYYTIPMAILLFLRHIAIVQTRKIRFYACSRRHNNINIITV